jgi:exodeoxyribonuclease-3
MRIATFNANSIRSRMEIVLDWLKTNQPDALAIQETKVEDKDFPSLAFREAGYQVVFKGQKSYNGVALVTRVPATDLIFGLDDDGPRDEPRLLAAKVGPVYVVNTYVPQGRELDDPMYPYKLAWFGRLKAFFDRHYTPRQKVVWFGDINVAPEAIDIHNASEQENHVCYHIDVRRAFADTVSWGFTDVFRKYHPEPGQYTFFDYRTINALKRNMGWRVDHILATKSLAATSTGAFIDLEPRQKEKSSDHTFLVADFEV